MNRITANKVMSIMTEIVKVSIQEDRREVARAMSKLDRSSEYPLVPSQERLPPRRD